MFFSSYIFAPRGKPRGNLFHYRFLASAALRFEMTKILLIENWLIDNLLIIDH